MSFPYFSSSTVSDCSRSSGSGSSKQGGHGITAMRPQGLAVQLLLLLLLRPVCVHIATALSRDTPGSKQQLLRQQQQQQDDVLQVRLPEKQHAN